MLSILGIFGLLALGITITYSVNLGGSGVQIQRSNTIDGDGGIGMSQRYRKPTAATCRRGRAIRPVRSL